ncbi:MAG: 3'(2'),5'-bisphosphate nucleotidase CysQ family protein, partial [Planctomycetota bacterium]
MDTVQYDKLIITTILAAKHAGEAILDVYDSDFAVEQKDDKSPLTLADKRSHEIIQNVLEQTITVNNTTVPILSEEGKETPYVEREKWEYFWLVDPLDGTKEFVKRNGEFTVNIALMHKDKPVLGIIYIPVKDIFYFAAKDFGAYKLENS